MSVVMYVVFLGKPQISELGVCDFSSRSESERILSGAHLAQRPKESRAHQKFSSKFM